MLPFVKKKSDLFLFAGLGNPGDEYAGNRHNAGFLAVDAIAAAHGFGSFKKKFKGELSEGTIGDAKVILIKPQTFINLSGESIAAAARFYKIDLTRIFVFYDELDLEPGKIRVKKGGGAAGHNGIRSTDSHLGTPEYWRVRIGIGHPGDRAAVSNYVLSDFAKAERSGMNDLFAAIGKHAGFLTQNNDNEFMSRIALELQSKG